MKHYKCIHCGIEHIIGTNHYGEVYSQCPNAKCLSNRPHINCTYQPPKHICLEPLPDNMTRPTPWSVVHLRDIVEII